jgi:hypothetical protein
MEDKEKPVVEIRKDGNDSRWPWCIQVGDQWVHQHEPREGEDEGEYYLGGIEDRLVFQRRVDATDVAVLHYGYSGKQRYFSPETRQKLSIAATRRWETARQGGGDHLTPEGRKKLSDAMKARWQSRRDALAEAADEEANARMTAKQRIDSLGLRQLAEALAHILGSDHDADALKKEILDAVPLENILHALDNDSFGTAQRERLRDLLRVKIVESVGL